MTITRFFEPLSRSLKRLRASMKMSWVSSPGLYWENKIDHAAIKVYCVFEYKVSEQLTIFQFFC